MKVLIATCESAPFVKVGGLGDVCGALPAALRSTGVDARVILPLYSCISEEWRKKMTFVTSFEVNNSWRRQYCGIYECIVDGVPYYLVDNLQYFDRPSVYGEADNAERFAYFCRAVMTAMKEIDFIPDILHCNDWHTAFLPVLQHVEYAHIPAYQNIKTVYSIHNIEFQGQFDPYILGDVFGLGEEHKSLLLYDGALNLTKGAIECANYVTTVSETYATEILDPAFGYRLENILREKQFKLCGIVNGIDVNRFDPATDPDISTNYSFKTRQHKVHCKRALQKELGLPENAAIPVIGMVTRLTPQKGLDLVRARADRFLQGEVQLVILGTGYPEYENFFRDLQNRYPDKVRVQIAFSAVMAQHIYAGADLFLMPSKFEPCGLAQMIAMRYGTIPVVHAVGGLRDTVIPYRADEGTGNGINFQSYNADDMLDAIYRALSLYHDKVHWRKIKANAMSGDYSWEKSAARYKELYEKL